MIFQSFKPIGYIAIVGKDIIDYVKFYAEYLVFVGQGNLFAGLDAIFMFSSRC